METYEHERWHKLANDLQPIMSLPREMGKELGRLEGKFETAIGKAVESAIKPIAEDVAMLKRDVEALKIADSKRVGQQTVWKSILQSPIIGGIIGALIALGTIMFTWLKAAR